MNPQQSLTCSEHNTYDPVTVVSTAAPLQPKSSGPLSQPAEPVSYNLRSLLELGWEGEGLLQLLFSESASDRGLNSDNRSSIQAHLLTPNPTSICFHKSLQCFVWKKSELPQATKFSETIHLGSSQSGAPSGLPLGLLPSLHWP